MRVPRGLRSACKQEADQRALADARSSGRIRPRLCENAGNLRASGTTVHLNRQKATRVGRISPCQPDFAQNGEQRAAPLPAGSRFHAAWTKSGRPLSNRFNLSFLYE